MDGALVSIEKIYQTLKTVFDHISKHLEVRKKRSAARRIFNSVFGNVVKHGLSCLTYYIKICGYVNDVRTRLKCRSYKKRSEKSMDMVTRQVAE